MSDDNKAVINMEAFTELQELMSDETPEFFIELLEGFIEESQEGLDKIQQALASGNALGVEQAAHSMKSSSAHLGATAMSDLCRTLQEQGRGGDITQSPAYNEQLLAEFARVKAFIESKIQELQ